MANKAISELPQASNVNNQDLFVLEQSGIAKKLTAETFITEQGIIDALAEALDGHGGIQSVTLQSLSGRIRTYLITFTDESATTFQVLDGTSIDRIVKTSTAGLTDTYTVFMNDGSTTFFTVTNGADGTVSEAMLNDALKNKAPAITETTESSAIANFPDGADDMPVAHLTANIEPVQDLTYGDPYPAGGSKNLLNMNADITVLVGSIPEAVTITTGEGTASITETYYSRTANIFGWAFNVEENADYTVSCMCSSSVSATLKIYTSDGTTLYSSNLTKGAQNSRTFSSGSNTVLYFYVTVTSWGQEIELSNLQIEKSSSATSYMPYANICPITGWTGCNVTRTGKNLANLLEIGTFSESKAAGSTYESMKSNNNARLRSTALIPTYGKQITVSWSSYSNYGVCFTYFDSDGLYLGQSAGFQSWRWAVTTINNSAVYYIACAVRKSGNGTMTESDISALHLQVEFGTTATSYEEYVEPTTVSVDWTTEAGTVYGGTIDVTTGVLTVTDANIASYNGETLPSTWISDRDVYASGTTPTTGAQVVYKLATPQTYQLTGQQLKTLYGTNNLLSNVGNVSVTYPADTKMFIEKLTMPTEDDLVANQAITSGKYFMIGNSLYLALANIASGAQITIGTNAQRVSLADALNAINS